jgi:hypothetical protein
MLTRSSKAFAVSTTSRGTEGVVAHSPGFETQNSAHPTGDRATPETST